EPAVHERPHALDAADHVTRLEPLDRAAGHRPRHRVLPHDLRFTRQTCPGIEPRGLRRKGVDHLIFAVAAAITAARIIDHHRHSSSPVSPTLSNATPTTSAPA